MAWISYFAEFVAGTFWAFVFALIAVGIAMFLIDYLDFSGWWAVGVGAVAVILMMLIPHGYRLLELMFSSQPAFQFDPDAFSQDRLKTLVEYRFWGGLAGCIVGTLAWDHFFGSRQRWR